MILDWEVGGSFPVMFLEFPVQDSEFVPEEDLDAVAVRMGPTGATGAAGDIYKVDFVNQSVWTLNHNLGREVFPQVYSVGGLLLMAEIHRISTDQLTVSFDTPTSGYILYR